MAKQITRAESALITDNLKTTSLIVAEKFGKEHSKVMRSIEAMNLPRAYRIANFGETVIERPNPSGGAPITSKAFELTRDGFALLVMGFTGKRAMGWKIKFLEAFNKMEQELLGPRMAKGLVNEQSFLLGLKAKFATMAPEELSAWAHGRASKVDQIITYIETTLLDPSLSAETRAELARLSAITKHLRGDAPAQKSIFVKAHLRKPALKEPEE